MFGFLKKRAEERRRSAEVVEMGREGGAKMFDAITKYLETRIRFVSEQYIDVLRGQLKNLNDRADRSPVELDAGALAAIFCEKVGELQTSLIADAQRDLKEWLDIAEWAGVRVQTVAYISITIANACEALTQKGVAEARGHISEDRGT
jgi:hypothetical protein